MRYGRWLGLQPVVSAVTGEKSVDGVLQGNLGFTLSSRRPVAEELTPRFGPTLLLMTASIVLAVMIVNPVRHHLGGHQQYSRVDYVLTGVTMLIISTPTFVLGLLLIYFLGVSLRLLPIGGMVSLGTPFSLARPVRAHGDAGPDPRIRQCGAADAIHASQDARGAQQRIRDNRARERSPSRDVLIRHGLRNAMMPLITVIGLILPELVAGAIITEQVFSWPGMGRWPCGRRTP